MAASKTKKRVRRFVFPWAMIRKISIFIALALGLVFCIFKLKSTEYFPITAVKIYGVQHVDHQEVEALVAPYVTNKGFFAVNIENIKDRIVQLPWIADVTVRRKWPEQLTIIINEKSPIAVWNAESLLSSAGEIFTPAVASFPAQLPQFSGPAGEQILMSWYYAKINDLLTVLHFKITKLELTPAFGWTITLDNGIKLNIGHKDVLTRLSHFVKVYPQIVGDNVAGVDYIDLRYPNGAAVHWKTKI